MATIIESLFKAKSLDIATVGKFIEHSIKNLGYDFQDTVGVLINGVEEPTIDSKYLMFFHSTCREDTPTGVSNIVINPFNRTIHFKVHYKSIRWYKDEKCSGWDYERHQSDNYPYSREVDDNYSYSITYKEYEDIATHYNSKPSPVEETDNEL